MSKKIEISMRSFSLIIISFLSLILFSGSAFAATDGVRYKSHVENIGWQDYVQNGAESGTTGKSLRVEALQIELINNDNLGIEYSTHVQELGWMSPVSNGAVSGTEGRALRVEAIRINLTGSDAANYNVYYRVHSENYGWLGWAKNGENAGTAQKALRIEALQVLVKPVNEPAPENTSGAASFIEGTPGEIAPAQPADPARLGSINYHVYSNSAGWTGYAQDGGQMGVGDRIEAVEVNLNSDLEQYGGVIYRTLTETAGWGAWVKNGETSGYAGLGIQAIRLQLTSKLPYMYEIYYRVHAPGVGWSNWAKNGESCGSEGYGRNISHIQIMLTHKGDRPQEGAVGNAFVDNTWRWPLDGYRTISSNFGPRNGTHHDGIDIPAPEGVPIHATKSGIVKLASYNGGFGNCVMIEQDSGEMVCYGHMVRIGCSLNQRVNRGDVIGYVGNTGNSLGNHLHLEVYSDSNELVTPLTYLR